MRGGYGGRRASPRARGRRNRQDAHARPPRRVSHRAGRSRRSHTSSYLYQPRRARDARACRKARWRRGRVDMVWHLPLDMRAAPQALRQLHRLFERLPDSRRGRPEEARRRNHKGGCEEPEGLPEKGSRREDDLRGGERVKADRDDRREVADEDRRRRPRGNREGRREVRRAKARAQLDGL